jgi:hypothetical protein
VAYLFTDTTNGPGFGNTAGSTSFTYTVGTGVTSSMYVVCQISGASNVADETITATLTRAGGGGTFTSMGLVGTGSNNHWATYVKATGIATGDVITVTLSGSRLVWMYPHVFSTDLPTVGTFGSRAGVSGATVTAPTLTVTAGQVVALFATARDTGTSSIPTNNNTFTKQFFNDETLGAQCSYYVGEKTISGTTTGATTLTYSLSSGNASALHVAETTVSASRPRPVQVMRQAVNRSINF